MTPETLQDLEAMLTDQAIDTLKEWRRTPRWQLLRRWGLRGAWAQTQDWLRRIRIWQAEHKEETP